MTSHLVLVVDDDADTRELYKLVFEVGGFRVAEADSFASALRAAHDLRPDLIVTDWMLGDGDGLMLCRGLRRHGSTRLIPVVAASGMSLSEPTRAQARAAGIESFLTKPIDMDVMLRTVTGALQMNQARVLRAATARIRRAARKASLIAAQGSAPLKLSGIDLIAASRARIRSSVALLIADDAGRYVAVNERAAELTGYDQSILATLSVADLTPEPEASRGEELWHRFMESGAQEGVFLLKRQDGATVPLRYVAVANIAPGLHLSALAPAPPATNISLVA